MKDDSGVGRAPIPPSLQAAAPDLRGRFLCGAKIELRRVAILPSHPTAISEVRGLRRIDTIRAISDNEAKEAEPEPGFEHHQILRWNVLRLTGPQSEKASRAEIDIVHKT